jgi:hypothetical protein
MPRAIRRTDGPGSVAADEGSQYGRNAGPIGRRVQRESLECVDAAEPDVELATAKVLDRLGEPFGRLALTCDPDLLPGGCGAGNDEESSEDLQQLAAEIVLKLVPAFCRVIRVAASATPHSSEADIDG